MVLHAYATPIFAFKQRLSCLFLQRSNKYFKTPLKTLFWHHCMGLMDTRSKTVGVSGNGRWWSMLLTVQGTHPAALNGKRMHTVEESTLCGDIVRELLVRDHSCISTFLFPFSLSSVHASIIYSLVVVCARFS